MMDVYSISFENDRDKASDELAERQMSQQLLADFDTTVE